MTDEKSLAARLAEEADAAADAARQDVFRRYREQVEEAAGEVIRRLSSLRQLADETVQALRALDLPVAPEIRVFLGEDGPGLLEATAEPAVVEAAAEEAAAAEPAPPASPPPGGRTAGIPDAARTPMRDKPTPMAPPSDAIIDRVRSAVRESGRVRLGELAKRLGLSQPPVSKALRILAERGEIEHYGISASAYWQWEGPEPEPEPEAEAAEPEAEPEAPPAPTAASAEEARQAVLDTLQAHGGQAPLRDLVDTTGMTQTRVSKALRDLRDDGQVVREGTRNTGYWALPVGEAQPDTAPPPPPVPPSTDAGREWLFEHSPATTQDLAAAFGMDVRWAGNTIIRPLFDTGHARRTGDGLWEASRVPFDRRVTPEASGDVDGDGQAPVALLALRAWISDQAVGDAFPPSRASGAIGESLDTTLDLIGQLVATGELTDESVADVRLFSRTEDPAAEAKRQARQRIKEATPVQRGTTIAGTGKRDPLTRHPEMRKLIEDVVAAGGSARKASGRTNGHIAILDAKGREVCQVSSTPSDHRTALNERTKVRHYLPV